MPVHLQPYYRKLGFMAGQCPEAERHGGEAITLPLYYGLRVEEQDSVAVTLQQLLLA
jgi:dTDP-4-amino-4,6-dideoxygalactose transaminase